MGFQPFMVANYEENSGLNKYFESFLIPERAFPELEDIYCFRGRLKRRKGVLCLGRLRRKVTALGQAATSGAANYVNGDLISSFRTAPLPETYAEIESDSGVVITISRGNADVTTYTDFGTPGVLTLVAGPYTISSGTINYVTGGIVLNFTVAPAAGKTVDATLWYFPALPCMGLRTEERPEINQERMIAFDQKYAYYFDVSQPPQPPHVFFGRFVELPSTAATTWSSTNDEYFWTTNYWQNANGNLFWATNFNSGATGDPIRYYDTVTWTAFAPILNAAGDTLNSCLCLFPFKNRLIAAFTVEKQAGPSYVAFPQRIRYSQNGTPLPADDVTAWREDIPGKGGFLELPTDERIISIQPLKDMILVKCETSSWKLLYTGNEILPFIFQKINEDFGAMSTFSLVPFDSNVLSVGNFGITQDDSTRVERIDMQIPDQYLEITNVGTPVDQQKRVYGIRDFNTELVYWTYPSYDLYVKNSFDVFANKLLVFNYRNNTYSKFNDIFTVLGYFQYLDTPDLLTAGSFPNATEIAGGNQQGFVEILNKRILNEKSLAIYAITPGTPVVLRVPNHNLSSRGDYWVTVNGIIGTGPNSPTALNYTTTPAVYHVTPTGATPQNDLALTVWNQTTQTFDPVTLAAGGTYLGGGTLTIVQNFSIKTKTFAPFYEEGKQGRFGYVDFLIDRTDSGQVTCNVLVNESSISASLQGSPNLGSNVLLTSPENLTLVPSQIFQTKIWHRFFVQSIAQNFQIELNFSNLQMSDSTLLINNNDLVIHAMTLYLSPTARMTQ